MAVQRLNDFEHIKNIEKIIKNDKTVSGNIGYKMYLIIA